MSDRVTMQDIADALGLSRNTVSKAINNTGIIAAGTKELILKKAVEMGYRHITDPLVFSIAGFSSAAAGTGEQFAFTGSPAFPARAGKDSGLPAGSRKEIAMLTAAVPGGSHFAVTTLDRMQHIFSSLGYSLTIYRVLPGEISALKLPGSMDPEKVAGIFCFELFNYEYCRMLCALGLPLLLIDTPVCFGREPLPADILLMENRSGIFTFLKQMSEKGKTTVGFIGNMMHCRSFFERGSACISAAGYFGFEPVRPYSILNYPPGKAPASFSDYTDELYRIFEKKSGFPQILVCANDFLAINVISSLRRLGVRCPEDISILGFDDSPESRFHAPALSTVHIHTQSMGTIAAESLLARIADSRREHRTIYVPTDLILRESGQA